MIAGAQGHLDIVTYLIENKTFPFKDINAVDKVTPN